MTSGGPRCADVSFPAKTVQWVNIIPTDSSGNNGFKEIQIWDTSGSVYSQNNCVKKFQLTPVTGNGLGPLVQNPPPTSCPTSWNCADIGSPDLAGGQDLSNGTWAMQGYAHELRNEMHGMLKHLPKAVPCASRSLTMRRNRPWHPTTEGRRCMRSRRRIADATPRCATRGIWERHLGNWRSISLYLANPARRWERQRTDSVPGQYK